MFSWVSFAFRTLTLIGVVESERALLGEIDSGELRAKNGSARDRSQDEVEDFLCLGTSLVLGRGVDIFASAVHVEEDKASIDEEDEEGFQELNFDDIEAVPVGQAQLNSLDWRSGFNLLGGSFVRGRVDCLDSVCVHGFGS